MGTPTPITAPSTLSAGQRDALRALIGLMIPASAKHGVPGADDERIFADILASAAPIADRVAELLRRLDELADEPFADLDPARREQVAQRLRQGRSSLLMGLVSVVAQCYYRDDRVMRALDMEVRPPFPRGFDVEQGDWALLEPVRRRSKMYRPT